MNPLLTPDPLERGLIDYGQRLRSGAISAEQCVTDYLERIRRLDGALCAYRHVAWESALSAARDIDRQLRSGIDLGPLMGVPVALKDIIVVDGMPTTFGSQIDLSNRFANEGSFVARLRASGCVLLGKLATCEFAVGSAGVNYLAGTPRNPWDAQDFRVPGGSSSGSAVAVAAGLCGFSIGTDTGGSVRTPAAFCGVFGMKPSAGLWALDGVLPMAPSLDSIGFMARSAADAAVIGNALGAVAASAPVTMAGLRLARPRGLFTGQSRAVAATVQAAFTVLEAAGAEFMDVDLPELDASSALFNTISSAELVAGLGAAYRGSSSRVNPDVAKRFERGYSVTTDELRTALAKRQSLMAQAAAIFETCDAMLGPTKHHVAPVFPGRYEHAADESMASLCVGPTRAANVLDLCAASLPLRPVETSLPVGLQIIGARGAESRLLSIAQGMEAVLGTPATPELNRFLGEPTRGSLHAN